MRGLLFRALGVVEFGIAAGLIALGAGLPAQDNVAQSFEGARRVTAAAGRQVQSLKGRVGALRRSKLWETADRLRASTGSFASVVKAQKIDVERVQTLRDALGHCADGLASLREGLNAESLSSLGAGLGEAADLLDRGVVPAASRAAEGLEAASRPLQASARLFKEMTRTASLDLSPVREFRDSLARFDEGMAATVSVLDPRRLTPLREAADGAEKVIDEAAKMAERAGGYSYPVVELEGLKPRVKVRPFWPQGAELGVDLRKVAAGLTAMGREVEALSRELPRIQSAVAESRKALTATRKGLSSALDHQIQVDRILKEMPEHAGRLADALPGLTTDLTRALRSAERLGGVAASLRRARREVDASQARMPEVRRGLAGSGSLLLAARDRLDGVLSHREEYEAAIGQFERLSAEFSKTLPTFTDGLVGRLEEEDRLLDEMAGGIEQFKIALPLYSRALSRCVGVGRLLAWLSAAVATVHGLALILRPSPGRNPGEQA